MKRWLIDNRRKISNELKDINIRKDFSPTAYALYHTILDNLSFLSEGKLIDIGCGDMPYRNFIEPNVEAYDTLDMEARVEGVTYLGSITDMNMIPDETYDSAVSFEVLEHVPNPFAAVREIHRILKNNGIFILSVPHLSRLHEEPHDYYRYTHYGIRSMLEKNGFNIVNIQRTAGLFCFLGHQSSSIINCMFWGVPVVKWLVFYLNKYLNVLPCYYVDRKILRNSPFPLGYVCVAKKAV